MSTTTAARSLFARWIDNAAVFPPGNAPVPRAWTEHLQLLDGGYAELLGPLLIGTSGVEELIRAAEAEPAPERRSPVAVSVVGRAGTSVDEVADAVRSLRRSTEVLVQGAEVVHGDGDWRRLVDLGLRTAVEVPGGGAAQVEALDDLASGVAQDVGDTSPAVVAKLRTQATTDTPAPSPRQLAEFLSATHARGLPFKLTGGLHRALAHGDAEDNSFEHGALNVLVATHHLRDGAGLPDLTATLGIKDPAPLAALVRGLTEQEGLDLRARFTSFGCCGVLDPIGDLVELGLIRPVD